MLKKILPVGIGVVLILLIALVATGIKSATSKNPTFSEANDVYASIGDYDITYDRLYTGMKNSYGLNELVNLVDEQIFADQVAENETNKVFESDAYITYLVENIFTAEDYDNFTDEEKETAVEAWNDVCTSLLINNKITVAECKASKITEFSLDTIKASKAWAVMVDEYKLPYTRVEWAKTAYWEKYLEDNDVTEDEPFKMTNADSSTDSIEAYYDANYLSTVNGLFIPFTSKASALKAMEAVGINTNSKVLTSSATGWIKNSYNYNETATIPDDAVMSYNEVFEAFIKLYNLAYSYQNDGVDLLTSADYEDVIWNEQTATRVADACKDAFKSLVLGTELAIPETIEIALEGTEEKAKFTWSIVNNNYATYENGVLKGVEDQYDEDDKELTFSLSYTVTFGDAEVTGTMSNTFSKTNAENATEADPVDSVFNAETVGTITPFKAYKFTESALNRTDVKLTWNSTDTDAVNSTLTSYLSVDSTNLTISSDPSTNLYKSYTLSPIAMGNYYVLVLKTADHPVDDLFVTNSDGEYEKNDDGSYKLMDGGDAIVKEIIAKKKDELINTEDNLTEMLYLTRNDHNIQIYDHYVEAVYEYQYDTFFGTTLALDTYDEFKTSKKTTSKYVVSVQKEAGNKKSVVKIETKELFDRLEAKYATSVLASYFENYFIITSDFNKIYNPYASKKEQIIDKDAYKNALTSDAATLKRYFENGNFTQSSLASYGFIPNFPAKYGWSNFIKDYFLCYSDQELLTSSTYGGTIYNNIIDDYLDSLYSYDESTMNTLFKGHEDLDIETIKAEMEELYNDYYALKVVNVVVSIDPNYNSDSSSDSASTISTEHRDDWTTTQAEAAKELLTFIFKVASQTNEDSLADQLSAVADLYSEAAIGGSKASNTAAELEGLSIYEYNYFGYYKSLGLFVKAESEASYDSSSSLVEDFVKVCQDVYDEIVADGLVGEDLDQPIITDAFLTDYGYHMFAVTGSTEALGLPTEKEIAIYRAQDAIDTIDSNIESTQSTIDTYSSYGYDVSSYEAQLVNYNTERAELVEKLNAVLDAQGLDHDYVQDDATKEKLEQWAEPAIENIEDGKIVSKAYVVLFENALTSEIKFSASTMNEDRFRIFVDILKEECLKED